jgi:Icc-related predicted phosphoesterase
MKVLATSDLHGVLPEIDDCDVLIIGGDVCPDHPIGKVERYALVNNGSDYQLEWLDTDFRRWLNSLNERGISVVGIAGNHDFVFERMKAAVAELHLPWTYLLDEEVEVAGLRIYGTPWVPGLPRWAFHASDGALVARAATIPRDLDILISHGPPYGILDFVAPQFGSLHVGDVALRNALEDDLNPQVLVCGHIHEQYGGRIVGSTSVLNVSHNDENYNPINPPVELVEFTYN